MHTRVWLISLVGSLGLLLLIVELVRRRKLKEKYSLLWLFTAVVLLVLTLSPGLLDRLSTMIGIYYSPSAFFLMAFFFLMLITLQFSVVISKLSERNKALAQEVALLKMRLDELDAQGAGMGER